MEYREQDNKSILLFSLLNLLITVIGIPLIPFYRKKYLFELFSYLFIVAHSVFFVISYIFTLKFRRFTENTYFSLLDEASRIYIKNLWKKAKVVASISLVFSFSIVAIKDWMSYLTNPDLYESTPQDHHIYGSLFSFGPWGWAIFALFTLSAVLLFDAVLNQAFILVAFSKFSLHESTASREEWNAWLHLYLVLLLWTITFTLPFSISNGSQLLIMYSAILISPTVSYIFLSIVISQLQLKIDSTYTQDIFRTIQSFESNILRDISMPLAFSTLVLLLQRYYISQNTFLTNPIFYIFGFIVIFSYPVIRYFKTPVNEFSIEDYIQSMASMTENISAGDVRRIMSLKISHFFILDFIKAHPPTELTKLKSSYPNTYSNFRSTLKTLTDNDYVEIIPNIECMNSRLVVIKKKGMEILDLFHKFIFSKYNEIL